MRHRHLSGLLLAAAMASCHLEESPQEFPLADYVNPLQGTASERSFSTGNTYPAVAVPWGMNFWTPQTRANGDGWQYVWSDSTIRGFKQTHQPSPWINDYGCFSIMPATSNATGEHDRAASFSHEHERSHPYYYQVELGSGITARMSATNSGAVFRFTYPDRQRAYLILDCFEADGAIRLLPAERKLVGYSRYYAPNNNARAPGNFATHFVISFDCDIVDWGFADPSAKPGMEYSGSHALAWIKLRPEGTCDVQANVASSFVGEQQALVNHQREVAGRQLEEVRDAAFAEWNAGLGRIRIEGATREQRHTFYTALYRTMLFPRRLHEYLPDGTRVHYSAFTGRVEPGPMYTDNGFWDTFRAVHPLFTILYPDMSSEFIESMLNYYREGGWLPEWASLGYKASMIGQHSVSIPTDAYAKGIRGFDEQLMLQAMLKGANAEGPNATGRSGFDLYNRLGYVPCDAGVGESVSKTLEYAYNDWCISRYAEMTGADSAIVALHRGRAYNWKNVFDGSIGFVRPKRLDGTWLDPYSPDMWGGAFTEGSAWHWTWCVYHDPQGLARMMGGKRRFVAMLDSVFTAPPTFDTTGYGRTIHEMTEMVAGGMGQYAHGNQPVQHMIYLYAWAGESARTQFHVRDVMDRLYRSGLGDGGGLCGDEDNGQTSAWYIFSALGFYPVCPGSGQYIIGSPLFNEASLILDNGKTFTVKARRNSPRNIYIRSATLNGEPMERCFITHDQIMEGGVLEFEMSRRPHPQWPADGTKPYSLSDNVRLPDGR